MHMSTISLTLLAYNILSDQWCTQEYFWVGVQQIQLRTKGRGNGDLGACQSRVPLNL
jgi:hypothetical protein